MHQVSADDDENVGRAGRSRSGATQVPPEMTSPRVTLHRGPQLRRMPLAGGRSPLIPGCMRGRPRFSSMKHEQGRTFSHPSDGGHNHGEATALIGKPELPIGQPIYAAIRTDSWVKSG